MSRHCFRARAQVCSCACNVKWRVSVLTCFVCASRVVPVGHAQLQFPLYFDPTLPILRFVYRGPHGAISFASRVFSHEEVLPRVPLSFLRIDRNFLRQRNLRSHQGGQNRQGFPRLKILANMCGLRSENNCEKKQSIPGF